MWERKWSEVVIDIFVESDSDKHGRSSVVQVGHAQRKRNLNYEPLGLNSSGTPSLWYAGQNKEAK